MPRCRGGYLTDAVKDAIWVLDWLAGSLVSYLPVRLLGRGARGVACDQHHIRRFGDPRGDLGRPDGFGARRQPRGGSPGQAVARDQSDLFWDVWAQGDALSASRCHTGVRAEPYARSSSRSTDSGLTQSETTARAGLESVRDDHGRGVEERRHEQ